MASVSYAARLCTIACRRVVHIPRVPRIPRTQRVARGDLSRRAFTSSPAQLAPRRRDEDEEEDDEEYREEEEEDEDFEEDEEEAARRGARDEADEAKAARKRARRDKFSPEVLAQLDELAQMHGAKDLEEHFLEGWKNSRDFGVDQLALEKSLQAVARGPKVERDSFWYDEEDPFTSTEEADPFDEDDITSMAHGRLDEIRDFRHYARLAVWEMPLLSKFAKPFEVPKDTEVLRWRYTTYMGEAHPGDRKVVVQFAPDDLKLTPVQTSKLIKLAGTRYNPGTELIKMSSDSFEHQAQNKRYLSNLVDTMVEAAKDPTDTFEDVPLDTRHYRVKTKPKFPAEWRLTAERAKELEDIRERERLEDGKRMEEGTLVEGTKLIRELLMKQAEESRRAREARELVGAAAPPPPRRPNRARR